MSLQAIGSQLVNFVSPVFTGAARTKFLGLTTVAALISAVYVYMRTQQTKGENQASLAGRLKPYFELLDQNPQTLGPDGDASKGEIQIVRDPDLIAKIEKETGQKVGILAETRWQTFLSDPVKFPNGNHGVYSRILWRGAIKGPPGAVVLPILPDGKILLICIYRHPLRKWVLELPRGAGEGTETIMALAKRELREETGAEIGEAYEIGRVNADSGITSGNIPVVKVKITKFGEPKRDDAESSISLYPISFEDLRLAIQKGSAPVKINGQFQDVEIGTDGFLLSALLLNQLNSKENTTLVQEQ